MLAMDSVGVMPVQAAIGTGNIGFLWTENRLNKAQKKGDTKYHDHNGHQPARRVGHGNVAKTCGREGRDREIERIQVVVDVFVPVVFDDKDDRGDDKNEDEQIDR